jgi:hypothetical protein
MKLLRNALRLSAALAPALADAHAQTLLFERSGDAAADLFGAEVAFAGDIDADGAPDFAVGAPSYGIGNNSPGMVRVFSGRTLQVLATWTGGAARDRFGYSIAAAGDLDGDGHGDVLIGAPQALQSNPGGYALVRSGATGLALHTFVGVAGEAFGQAVAAGGFVDGDSVPDLLIGAPYASAGGSSRGRVYVFSGASGALLRTHDGVDNWGTLGWALAFLGDLDGDGRSEYVASAPAAWNNLTLPRVRAFDGATGAVLWTQSANFSDELGWSLAPIADLSGDGRGDLLIGVMQDAGVGCGPCTGKGFVRAVDAASGAQLYQVNGTGMYVGLGWDVAAVGDIDGNGFEDFACGQPGTEGCGSSSLAVRIRDGQSGAALLDLPPVAAGVQFGFALASGDANGDGLRDLICGAPCTSSSGASTGSIHAYTIVRSVTPYCEAEPNSLGCAPTMSALGTPSATSGAAFDVRASAVLNHKTGLLFYGYKPRQTPFQGGHMCIVAPTLRTTVQSSGGSTPPAADCSGAFSIDFNARIQSGVDPALVATAQVFAQYWSRDPADPSTTNLSNALAFYVEP